MNRFCKSGVSVSVKELNAMYHKAYPFPVIPPGMKNILPGKRFSLPEPDTAAYKDGLRRNVAAYQPTNRPWMKDINTIHGSKPGSKARSQKQQ